MLQPFDDRNCNRNAILQFLPNNLVFINVISMPDMMPQGAEKLLLFIFIHNVGLLVHIYS